MAMMLSPVLFAVPDTVSSGGETFITLGDWGGMALGTYHSTTVTKVAEQMAKTASDSSISFVINTGDNFYYCGIQNTSDYQIDTDYTKPYAASALDVPWYGVLGNHEYGYDVDAQIELTKTATKPQWVIEDRYWTKRLPLGGRLAPKAHASFIFIDTSPCMSVYRSSDQSGWDPCSTLC